MALDNSSKETRPQVRGESNSKPKGLTRDYSIDEGLYKSALESVSTNVVDALRLANLGVDPTSLKKAFSVQEKISYETVTELDALSEKFQKYLDSAQTDRERALVQMEYQSKLDELREEKNRQLEEELKKDDIERMSAFFEKTSDVLEKNDASIRGALLGPLNLLIKPFEGFFGFDIGKSIREKLFGGKSKKNPTESDVAKIGLAGAGYLYVANTLKDIFKKDDENELLDGLLDKIGMLRGRGPFGRGRDRRGGRLPRGMAPRVPSIAVAKGGKGLSGILMSGLSKFFTSMFSNGGVFTEVLKSQGLRKALASSVSSGLTKTGSAFSTGGIVGSILAMGYSGAMGAIKAEENGVSKFSGFLGSFLGGNQSGIKGALAGMGKWGMLGFNIGMKLAPATGGISLIAGPLIGLAIGGVFGAIGGARLAKGFDAIGKWIKETLWGAIKDLLNIDKFVAIWKSDKSIGQKIWESVKTGLLTVLDFIPKLVGHLWNGLKSLFGKIKDGILALGSTIANWFKDNPIGQFINKWVVQPIKNFFTQTVPKFFTETVPNFFKGIVSFFTDPAFREMIASKIKSFFTESIPNFFSGLWEKLKSIGGIIWQGIKELGGVVASSKIGQFFSNYILPPLKNFFIGIKDFFVNIGTKIGGFLNEWVVQPISNFFTNIKNFFVALPSKISAFFHDKVAVPFMNVFNIVKNFFVGLPTTISKIYQKWIVKPIKKLLKTIKGFFTSIPSKIKGFFDKWVIQPISNFFTKIKDGFTNIISTIGNFFSTKVITPISNFFSGVKDGFVSVATKVGGFFEKWIITPIKNFFMKIRDLFVDIGTKVGGFFEKWIISPVKNFFIGIKDFFVGIGTKIGDFFRFIKDLGLKGALDIIFSGDTWEGEFDKWKAEDEEKKRKEEARKSRRVYDAILRPDGSVIETDPKDTLVALKDIPSAIRVEEQKRVATTLEREMPSSNGNTEVTRKMDTLIRILQNMLNKEPVKLTLPTMTRQDLDLIMTGGMI